MEIQKPSRRRRYHLEEFKQAVIDACCEPGTVRYLGIEVDDALEISEQTEI